MLSGTNTPTNERRRSWIGILFVLLLVCGCLGFAAGPGMPFVRNVLGSSSTITPTTNAVTRVPTKTEPPTDAATEGVTPENQSGITDTPDIPVKDGACLDPCDPVAPLCLAGLACVPSAAGSDKFVCYNRVICEPQVTEAPSVTEAPVCMCGDGICEQNRCNELVQNCPADCGPAPQPPSPPPVGAGPVCGDRVCNGNETCYTCSLDCGPC